MRPFAYISRPYRLLLLWLGLMTTSAALQGQSPVGMWKTIDDETNKPKSIVQIYAQNGKLYGKVVKLFLEPGEDPNPICEECKASDPRHHQPVMGMVILTDLQPDGPKKWADGKILDPANGSVYDCYLEMEGNDKVKVRGFIGTWLTGAALGRTQYWYREE